MIWGRIEVLGHIVRYRYNAADKSMSITYIDGSMAEQSDWGNLWDKFLQAAMVDAKNKQEVR